MRMSKAWIDAQIEQEIERGNHPDAVRDLASLVIARDYLCGGDEEMRKYGRRYSAHEAEKARHTDHLTMGEAEEWVSGMVSEDGHHGARWPFHEIRQYAGNFGIDDDDLVEFFAVINALAADYGMIARKYGVDKMEYWADMAKAWMHDKDAAPGKAKRYWEYIAKHGSW